MAKEGARYGLKGVVADPEEEDMDKLQEIQVREPSVHKILLRSRLLNPLILN